MMRIISIYHRIYFADHLFTYNSDIHYIETNHALYYIHYGFHSFLGLHVPKYNLDHQYYATNPHNEEPHTKNGHLASSNHVTVHAQAAVSRSTKVSGRSYNGCGDCLLSPDSLSPQRGIFEEQPEYTL